LTANIRYVLTLPPYRELPTPLALLQPIFDFAISLDHVYVFIMLVWSFLCFLQCCVFVVPLIEWRTVIA
jgi:hypothetical protein